MITAVFPGSFDPLTNGHLDVIKRASRIFEKLVVATIINPQKPGLIPLEKRKEIIQNICRNENLTNVSVDSFKGLLVNFLGSFDNPVIIKGIRTVADMESEYAQCNINKQISDGIDTVFIFTSPEYAFVSSTFVREVARLHGDVSKFVHPIVLDYLKESIK